MAKPKVFISYAAEDYSSAERLYDAFAAGEIDPWLDRKKLRPGQYWQLHIDRAIRSADFVLILISRNSATKRGFVQREVKQALDIWQDKLEEDVFLIPCRIEDCDVPDALRRFQWVDLFSTQGLDALIDTILQEQSRSVRARVHLGADASSSPLDIRISELTFRDAAKARSSYEANAFYPEISYGADPQNALNAIIKGTVFSQLGAFLNASNRISGPPGLDGPEEAPASWTNEFDLRYSIKLITRDVVSVEFSIVTYYAGAAHSNLHTKTLNFLQPGPAAVSFCELIGNQEEAVRKISKYCIESLYRQRGHSIADAQRDEWLESGAGPEAKNFEKYTLGSDGITIKFDPYQVDCYAAGPQIVILPGDQFLDCVTDELRCPLQRVWGL